jgi:amino acid transporter
VFSILILITGLPFLWCQWRLKGVSAVFFAYIGFDAISTTAEECENPQRDLQGYDVGYYNLYRLVHHNSIGPYRNG